MTASARVEHIGLPFAAVVGQTLAKRALLLLAVDPDLGGVLIAARPGTAKSTLARSFRTLLPDMEAVAGCASHCDPHGEWCSECRERDLPQRSQRTTKGILTPPPLIELPLNVTEDRLLGGLALEATLRSGRRVAERGLLAEANRGILYIDELNLLDSGPANYLLDALGRGRLVLEREGLSADYPTHFMLIGTYDPDESEVRGGLMDRVGLHVSLAATADPAARAEIMRRVTDFDRDPDTADYDPETAALRAMIVEARAVLPQVTITDAQIEQVAAVALRFGVVGNRADVYTVRAACAAAALAGRTEVGDDDLTLAVQLTILPRATRMPAPEEPEPEQQQQEPPPQQNADNDSDAQDDKDEPDEQKEQQTKEQELQDLLLDAMQGEVPNDLLNLALSRQRSAKSGSRGESYNYQRGRHVQSVPIGGGLSPRDGKIAIVATLRAAAPFQNARKNLTPQPRAYAHDEALPALRRKGEQNTTLTPLPPQGRRLGSSRTGGERPATPVLGSAKKIEIRADDLRLKRFKDKAGVLFIFVVDASGSMALNRMREAKGAVTQLLQQAYVHRDKVALISFRGARAETLLPPSQSVELAKRSLDLLPTGGGTPLASALLTAYDMGNAARRQGITKTLIVLITDGRGNVLLQEDDETANLPKSERTARATAEVQQLAAMLAADGTQTVVLDTQTSFLSKGDGATLARHLGGRYVYLPRANAQAIATTVQNAAEEIR